MSDMLPLATYSLNIEPFTPTPAIDVTTPVTIRITMAALNPESYDDEKKPSTLRIIKRNPDFTEDDDDILGDFDDEDMDSEEEEQKPKKKGSKKDSKKEEEEEEEEDSDNDDEDDEFEEFVLLTLSPESQYQQSLDITIAPEEEVQFVVTGSYAISLTGNFVKHPFDTPIIDGDEEDMYADNYSEDESDGEEYDLTPDEDEIIDEELDDELDDLEEASDVEGRLEELLEEEQKKDNKKKENKKRKQAEEEEKASKKAKKVEFKKDLEEGPTKKKQQEKVKNEEPKKPKTKSLEGGIMVEDRVVGNGPLAKKSSRIGMRYIGKLKNGKVFDKNTSGKPFVFKLGHGEVIKGWDVGVSGMAVGGERRIVIPSAYAYGKQALPGIPANSELTFDVKLVSMK